MPRRPREYGSLEDYYRASLLRRHSRKVDYGVWWYAVPPRSGVPPPWRVTYVRDTGEVFATPTDGKGPVHVLGIIPPPPPHRPFTETVDRLLTGWDNPDITGRQLAWVRNRLTPRATRT